MSSSILLSVKIPACLNCDSDDEKEGETEEKKGEFRIPSNRVVSWKRLVEQQHGGIKDPTFADYSANGMVNYSSNSESNEEESEREDDGEGEEEEEEEEESEGEEEKNSSTSDDGQHINHQSISTQQNKAMQNEKDDEELQALKSKFSHYLQPSTIASAKLKKKIAGKKRFDVGSYDMQDPFIDDTSFYSSPALSNDNNEEMEENEEQEEDENENEEKMDQNAEQDFLMGKMNFFVYFGNVQKENKKEKEHKRENKRKKQKEKKKEKRKHTMENSIDLEESKRNHREQAVKKKKIEEKPKPATKKEKKKKNDEKDAQTNPGGLKKPPSDLEKEIFQHEKESTARILKQILVEKSFGDRSKFPSSLQQPLFNFVKYALLQREDKRLDDAIFDHIIHDLSSDKMPYSVGSLKKLFLRTISPHLIDVMQEENNKKNIQIIQEVKSTFSTIADDKGAQNEEEASADKEAPSTSTATTTKRFNQLNDHQRQLIYHYIMEGVELFWLRNAIKECKDPSFKPQSEMSFKRSIYSKIQSECNSLLTSCDISTIYSTYKKRTAKKIKNAL